MLQGLYDIGYGTVLDSGTTFTYLPTAAFDQLQQHVSDYALEHGLHSTPGPDVKFQDICFGGAPDFDHPRELAAVFPSLELHFEVQCWHRSACRTCVVSSLSVTGFLKRGNIHNMRLRKLNSTMRSLGAAAGLTLSKICRGHKPWLAKRG